MLIKVMYRDRKFDMVKPEILNELIASKKIKKFKRAEGWTDVDTAPLRIANRSHEEPERRAKPGTPSQN